jgi:NTE family protein
MDLFRRKPTPAPEVPIAPAEPPAGPRRISLALQGGGAHGAFEWGVLDRLLEDERLEIGAVTAASAGAMNAVALACGLAQDGRRGAKAKLEQFWRAVNRFGGRNVFGDSAIWTAAFNPRWLQANPFYSYFESLLLSASPYDFNPFDLNPLRDLLREVIDFEAVKAAPIEVFVSATDVKAGKAKIFSRGELSPETVLASSALPQLFRAVQIEGAAYWDGGYVANPALWPLIYSGAPRDILLVMVNPFRREEIPRTAGDIIDRLNEVSFNATVTGELRAIAFVEKLIEDGLLVDSARSKYRHMLVHAIEADGRLDDLPLSSKFDTEWNFLLDVKARGRRAAEDWLAACFEDVGVKSSVDVRARFL